MNVDTTQHEEVKGQTTDPKRSRGPLTDSEFNERLQELRSQPWVSPKSSSVSVDTPQVDPKVIMERYHQLLNDNRPQIPLDHDKREVNPKQG